MYTALAQLQAGGHMAGIAAARLFSYSYREVCVKVSLGMIVKDIDGNNPLVKFIDNASKYGHPLENIILIFSGSADPFVVKSIREKCPLILHDINDPAPLFMSLIRRGISKKAAGILLNHDACFTGGKFPYGYSRNIVMMLAILNASDILIFADSDVLPAVLEKADGGDILREIDFIGSHMALIEKGAQVTSSEYSGYNILPKAQFKGQNELLTGLQKEYMADFWRESLLHNGLVYQPGDTLPAECKKVLGGNTAIRLSACPKLSPFFSFCYALGDETFLTRGEDTILSKSISDNGIICADTHTYIFHDTFADYPKAPDLVNDAKVQERFFYACMGWLGRNPFYNRLFGMWSEEDDRCRFEMLKQGVKALYAYTNYERYLLLPEAFAASRKNLDKMIDLYQRTIKAWNEFLKGCDLI